MDVELYRHPKDSLHETISMHVKLSWLNDSYLNIDYRYSADDIIISAEELSPIFRNELWKDTCFEMFIQVDSGYYELNFAPNGDWAAYHFDSYRSGMQRVNISQPIIRKEQNKDSMTVSVVLDMSFIGKSTDYSSLNIGLSAILHSDEGKSHWALKHRAYKPDFHQKDCFSHRLEAK